MVQGPPSGFEERMTSIMACKPIPNQTKCMQIMSKKEIVSFGTPKTKQRLTPAASSPGEE